MNTEVPTVPIEQLKFISVNTSMGEALKFAQEQSVDFRNAKLAYDTASRTYEKTLKDNLPLPRFDLNLGHLSDWF
jgi:hypothetical protein